MRRQDKIQNHEQREHKHGWASAANIPITKEEENYRPAYDSTMVENDNPQPNFMMETVQDLPPIQHREHLGLQSGMKPLPVNEDINYSANGKLKGKAAIINGSHSGIERSVAMPALGCEHRLFAKKLSHYWRDAKWSSYITTPAIVSCIIPVVLLDFWATAYQFICFPAYGIPKVQRHDYIILDRSKLRYLNSIERLNCAYCGYVNGAIAYVQEIAARTEQHWCPIKHAFRLKTMHSRYQHFLDYADAKQYRTRVEEVRRDFDDLKQ